MPPAEFDHEELPSGVVRRGPPPANYRRELTPWFVGASEPPPRLGAVGTSDATAEPGTTPPEAPALRRMSFLIF
jgi:hypothetical protein